MLSTPITLDFGSSEVVLNKINQDSYGSEYFGRITGLDCMLTIKHTFPKVRDSSKEESHLVRFDVQHYDEENVHVATSSAWTVISARKGGQVQAHASNTYGLLAEFLGDEDNLDAILGRQS
jgi:hypothetical protein